MDLRARRSSWKRRAKSHGLLSSQGASVTLTEVQKSTDVDEVKVQMIRYIDRRNIKHDYYKISRCVPWNGGASVSTPEMKSRWCGDTLKRSERSEQRGIEAGKGYAATMTIGGGSGKERAS